MYIYLRKTWKLLKQPKNFVFIILLDWMHFKYKSGKNLLKLDAQNNNNVILHFQQKYPTLYQTEFTIKTVQKILNSSLRTADLEMTKN